MEYSAYFFDLGGTLVAIENDEIKCSTTDRVTLLPGIKTALMQLSGKPIFVITNQAGVALGLLSDAQARSYIEQVNAEVGNIITDYRMCTHNPADGCFCRKPQPGMILELAHIYSVDLSQALMVGDALTDERCAQAAGIGTFLWASTFFGHPPTQSA